MTTSESDPSFAFLVFEKSFSSNVFWAARSLRRKADEYLVQSNLAISYTALGQQDEAARIEQDVYSGTIKLNGENHPDTLQAANNYAGSLVELGRFEEAKTLLRKKLAVAQRNLGESHELTLKLKSVYARALYKDNGATLDDIHEAVTTLEDTERIARRVLGSAHPITLVLETLLRQARAALRTRETPSSEA